MKRSAFYSYILFLLLITYSCSKRSENEVLVSRIVDGDTIEILLEGRKEKVRLIGIDTPESRINSKAKKDAKRTNTDVKEIKKMGIRATKYLKSILNPGDAIRIEFDVRERDQYGRLLAYIYLNDGQMLNDLLVREGFANILTYPPNVKYEERFRESLRYARENNKGFWAVD
ncbi:MAG: thermonuclease family protein [Melioribacteraceae bacterium]